MDDIKHPAQPAPLFLAGHPALDFLNTRMRRNGQLIDVLQRDGDVLNWLRKAGFPVIAGVASHFEHGALLNCARNLRENIRLLIEKRKAGQRGDAAVLNGFLADGQSHFQLVWSKPRQLRIETVRRQDSPVAILGPVAESAADLLATADFRFVKRCETRRAYSGLRTGRNHIVDVGAARCSAGTATRSQPTGGAARGNADPEGPRQSLDQNIGGSSARVSLGWQPVAPAG